MGDVIVSGGFSGLTHLLMCAANNIDKEFLKILWKNFLPTSSLYKIFNKNNIKLSYSCIPNVANLINKSNTKNVWINNLRSLLNAIALIKLIAPLGVNVNMKV